MEEKYKVELQNAAFTEVCRRSKSSGISQLLLVALTTVFLFSTDLLSQGFQINLVIIAGSILWRVLVTQRLTTSTNFGLIRFSIMASSLTWACLIIQLLSIIPTNYSAVLASFILTSGLTAASAYSLSPVLILLNIFNGILLSSLIGTTLWFYDEVQIHWSVLLYIVAYWGFTLRTGKIAFIDWKNTFLGTRELQSVIDAFPGGVSVLKNETYVLSNQWISQHMGLDQKTILNQKLGALNRDTEFVELIRNFLSSNELNRQAELNLQTTKGPRAHLILLKRIEFTKNEILVVTLDIEDQNQARNQLDRQKIELLSTAKMASLGQMSSGIAHEINNPLTIILAQIESIRRKNFRSPDFNFERLDTAFDKIEMMGLRISRIVKGLSLFAQDSQNLILKTVNLMDILEDTLSFCEARFKKANIQLKIDVGSNIDIRCAPTQLSQVFLNILNNAYDAIGSSEDRWVKLSAREIEDKLEIRISNSGPGIPPEMQDKIMTPFFTTKPPGKGTGLGLSISQGLISQIEGELFLDKAESNTTFVILLPTVKQKPKKQISA